MQIGHRKEFLKLTFRALTFVRVKTLVHFRSDLELVSLADQMKTFGLQG